MVRGSVWVAHCGGAWDDGVGAIMADRPTILVTETYGESAMARLASAGEVRTVDGRDGAALMAAVGDCDALVVRSYTRVTADVLAAAGRLRVIGRAGVGLDNIDVAAARERGVSVVYTPAASTRAVAEHTVGLMLALERRIVDGDAMVRDGRFDAARRTFRSRELAGLTLGIVGMGRIGQAVGRIAADGLGMRVVFNDIRDVGVLPFAATRIEKGELYSAADVVSLHVPLTDETRGLVDAAALRRFKATGMLINTSRGAVVDGGALAAALKDGRLAGAALDVLEREPPASDDALLGAPNCLLSPHVASRTGPSMSAMEDVVEDVVAVLRGEEPRFSA